MDTTRFQEYLRKTDGPKVKWYGNTSHKTNESTYFLDDPVSRDDTYGVEMREKFEAVVAYLVELAVTKDGNGSVVLEFIALRRCDRVWFVAYRFTSDWAYARYNSEVMQRGGGSLGRGVFEPFKDKYNFDHYLKE